jgi:hypothetical protein
LCDRTEASVGNQGLRAIERRRRSARHHDRTDESIGNQGSELEGSRAFLLLQPIERTRRSAFCYDKVEREKLGGCDDDRSGRFDGG